MPLKLLPKDQLKKEQKQLVISLVIKFLIKSRKFQKIYNKTIQRQLQFRMIKKYKRIPEERYISPEKRQKIIDELILTQYYNNGI